MPIGRAPTLPEHEASVNLKGARNDVSIRLSNPSGLASVFLETSVADAMWVKKMV